MGSYDDLVKSGKEFSLLLASLQEDNEPGVDDEDKVCLNNRVLFVILISIR